MSFRLIISYCVILYFLRKTGGCDQILDLKSDDNYSINNNLSVHALILARGGSKGIKLKNLVKIGNHSLLMRSLNAIRESNVFQSIWVSTDHELIEKEAIEGGAIVHKRSQESATDTATSIFAVQEFLEHHKDIEFLALVQCTSPFIKAQYLKEAFEQFIEKPCVFSVNRSFKLRWKDSKSCIAPLNFDPTSRPRRQDWNGELVENGMFYFATSDLLRKGSFQNNLVYNVNYEKRFVKSHS